MPIILSDWNKTSGTLERRQQQKFRRSKQKEKKMEQKANVSKQRWRTIFKDIKWRIKTIEECKKDLRGKYRNKIDVAFINSSELNRFKSTALSILQKWIVELKL